MDSPLLGFKALFSNGEYGPGLWKTASQIWFWRDDSSFFVIQIATIFDLITFSSYSGTAVLFAVVAFVGSWMLFLTFYKQYPDFHQWIAFATLFIPTVIFWGSGIFKDSITLSGMSIITYSFYRIFIEGRASIIHIFLIVVGCWVIYSIKIYILLCFLPAVLIWWLAKNLSKIQSMGLKSILAPFIIAFTLGIAYLAIVKVSEDNPRYNISKLSETAKITAYDIRYGWGARLGEGSGYTLGELDGTWQSMVRLAPQAINVSLFRPYIWEVKNSLMLLSALEGMVLFGITLFVIFRVRLKLIRYLSIPDVLFCLVFSLIFAFAVGVSTYNFGTLSRYKIPFMPYYLLALGLIYNNWKRDRNVSALESTE
jgi:hypothetical protein